MNLKKELMNFLQSLDGDELRNLADGSLPEEMAVDAYIASCPAEKVERFEKVTPCIGKNITEIKIGDTVYHRSIYEHKEPLKVVGIIENSLLLEGDYSGGTHNVIQKDLLPLKGTSRVYNHAYKERVRKDAVTIKTLAIPCKSQDNAFKCMIDMADAVLVLTSDVQLNPEF